MPTHYIKGMSMSIYNVKCRRFYFGALLGIKEKGANSQERERNKPPVYSQDVKSGLGNGVQIPHPCTLLVMPVIMRSQPLFRLAKKETDSDQSCDRETSLV